LKQAKSGVEVIRASVLWLVGVNLVPVAGVFLLGWDVSTILFLYWAENVVIGIFNLVKMKKARGQEMKSRFSINKRSPREMSRAGVMSFFLIHYGMFTLGHGVFVVALFGFSIKNLNWVAVSLLLMFISHGVSYFHNFIGREEFERVSYQDLFIQPYSRVVIMHITIIIGGFMVKSLGSPPAALLVMVGLKTVIDIFAHLKERRKSLKTVLNGRPSGQMD
jgi:hypothetical protein